MKILILLSLVLAPFVYADSWNGNNQPSNMGEYNYSFDALPRSGMVEEAHMPWSDNYWESDWGGISFRWNAVREQQRDPEGNESLDKYAQFSYTPPSLTQVRSMSKEELKKLSPAEKYDLLMGRYDYPTVHSERERTGPGYDDWQGICHGWVPAALNHPEPMATEATNTDGVVVPFGSSDIKALLSYYYGVPSYEFARGMRTVSRTGNTLQFFDQFDISEIGKWLSVASGASVFNSNWYKVSIDSLKDTADCSSAASINEYGSAEKCVSALSIRATVDNLNLVGQIGIRPSRGGRGIGDPNAGAFHVVMANQLGLMKRGFVGNINKKIRNGEIWNQPIVGYDSQITRDHRNGRRGSVDVTTKLYYVNEIAQQWEPVVGTPKQRIATFTFSYSLELDAYGNITGGEWDSRAVHPSFLWKHDKLEIRGYMSKLNEIYHSRF
jgi:hypothetical protein